MHGDAQRMGLTDFFALMGEKRRLALRLVRGGAGRGLERLFARFLRVALMAAWCPRLFLLLFSLSYVPG